jgi:hypothetical protein
MRTLGSIGGDLRRERERRGVSLDAVAAATKFRRSVIEDFEAHGLANVTGDFYRRAFLNAYGSAIGVPPAAMMADYYQLYAEAAAAGRPGMRLSAEPEPRWNTRSVTRMLTVVADTCVVLLLAGVITQATGMNTWVIGGALALAYHALATATLGSSPATWYANSYIVNAEPSPVPDRKPSRLASSDGASAIFRS